ncbi:MAG: hypothetical protein WBE18_01985 [Gammaproteobacteria bacterium]
MRVFYLCFVFFLTVILSPIGLAANASNYPVKWTSELKLQSIKEIPDLLVSPTYVKSQVKYVTDNRAVHGIAKTCKDFFHFTKKGFVAESNREINAENQFIKSCDPLIYLLHAKPAKRSYIRNFNIQKDYGLLPAKMIFPNLGSGHQPRGTLKKAFPHAQVTIMNPTSITLSSKKDDMKTSVSVFAWGNFSGGGYDQMLILIANHALLGTYHTYTPYVLTRKGANAPITVVKLPGQR